jgi:hypothetical protein
LTHRYLIISGDGVVLPRKMPYQTARCPMEARTGPMLGNLPP